jgi:hypothetical protein
LIFKQLAFQTSARGSDLPNTCRLATRSVRGLQRPSARRAWGMPGAQCTRSLVCAE